MHPVFKKMNQLGRDHVPFLFILDYALNSPVVIPLDDINPKEIQYSFGRYESMDSLLEPQPLAFSFLPPSKQVFKRAFDKVQNEIHAGNTYLTNLCFKIPIQTNWDLDTIFAQANAKYKLKYKDEFVFFSPETFVKINAQTITTFPMKGTIDATIPNAKNILLNDPKEDAEHATIVDLLRNDLSAVAKKVRLTNFKYLDLIENHRGAIWQMSSKIEGVLPKGYEQKIGDIFNQLLPVGSITGAPKRKTLEIIQEAENHARGYYTGVAGIVDGGVVDSAVMIRFVEKEDKQFFYRSGGGITSQSEMEKEYDELLKKIYIPTRSLSRFLLETIRLVDGHFYHLDRHQERLDYSRKIAFGDCVTPINLAKVLSESLAKYSFGRQVMKCRVVYGEKIERIEFLPYKKREISSLKCVCISDQNDLLKWEDRRFYRSLLAQKRDADEILIIRDGYVTDISYANVALFDGESWWTPNKPLLKGTTRTRLLDEGVIRPRLILADDLNKYQKIRIFNAMIPWSAALEVEIKNIKK